MPDIDIPNHQALESVSGQLPNLSQELVALRSNVEATKDDFAEFKKLEAEDWNEDYINSFVDAVFESKQVDLSLITEILVAKLPEGEYHQAYETEAIYNYPGWKIMKNEDGKVEYAFEKNADGSDKLDAQGNRIPKKAHKGELELIYNWQNEMRRQLIKKFAELTGVTIPPHDHDQDVFIEAIKRNLVKRGATQGPVSPYSRADKRYRPQKLNLKNNSTYGIRDGFAEIAPVKTPEQKAHEKKFKEQAEEAKRQAEEEAKMEARRKLEQARAEQEARQEARDNVTKKGVEEAMLAGKTPEQRKAYDKAKEYENEAGEAAAKKAYYKAKAEQAKTKGAKNRAERAEAKWDAKEKDALKKAEEARKAAGMKSRGQEVTPQTPSISSSSAAEQVNEPVETTAPVAADASEAPGFGQGGAKQEGQPKVEEVEGAIASETPKAAPANEPTAEEVQATPAPQVDPSAKNPKGEVSEEGNKVEPVNPTMAGPKPSPTEYIDFNNLDDKTLAIVLRNYKQEAETAWQKQQEYIQEAKNATNDVKKQQALDNARRQYEIGLEATINANMLRDRLMQPGFKEPLTQKEWKDMQIRATTEAKAKSEQGKADLLAFLERKPADDEIPVAVESVEAEIPKKPEPNPDTEIPKEQQPSVIDAEEAQKEVYRQEGERIAQEIKAKKEAEREAQREAEIARLREIENDPNMTPKERAAAIRARIALQGGNKDALIIDPNDPLAVTEGDDLVLEYEDEVAARIESDLDGERIETIRVHEGDAAAEAERVRQIEAIRRQVLKERKYAEVAGVPSATTAEITAEMNEASEALNSSNQGDKYETWKKKQKEVGEVKPKKTREERREERGDKRETKKKTKKEAKKQAEEQRERDKKSRKEKKNNNPSGKSENQALRDAYMGRENTAPADDANTASLSPSEMSPEARAALQSYLQGIIDDPKVDKSQKAEAERRLEELETAI